jgi:hypothetical protein
MTPEFSAYLLGRLNEALPDAALRPALEATLSTLATTDVRVDRVKTAFSGAMDVRGLARLEGELAHIDRIGVLTSPSAAITVLEHVHDGGDLRHARLIAEAGGDRAIALVKQSGADTWRLADAGVRWSRNLILQIMGLTAAALAVIWVVLASARHNIQPKLRSEDPH